MTSKWSRVGHKHYLHLPLVSAWFCCTVSITAVSGLYTAIIHLKICAEPRPRSY